MTHTISHVASATVSHTWNRVVHSFGNAGDTVAFLKNGPKQSFHFAAFLTLPI
jgi:hypothetical protein